MQPSCHAPKTLFHSSSSHLMLAFLLAPLSHESLSSMGRECDVDSPLQTEHATGACSLPCDRKAETVNQHLFLRTCVLSPHDVMFSF